MRLELPTRSAVPQDADTFERQLLTADLLRTDRGVIGSADIEPGRQIGNGPRGLPVIDWELTGAPHLAPSIVPWQGGPDAWRPDSALPKADVVVITWTSAEWDALHYVFVNDPPLPSRPDRNAAWRANWRPYRRNFYQVYEALWTHRLIAARRNRAAGAPALQDDRWGSFVLVKIGAKTVMLFKSDLHINQDGESLPLARLIQQIIEETQAPLILSIGTSGGVDPSHALGDVVVTNAAKFRLGQEFGSASFNGASYTCATWSPPGTYVPGASQLLLQVAEYDATPPTAHFPASATLHPRAQKPQIRLLPGVPILTTDFFEYGTTTNQLNAQGCCVEMDDAVVAMVAQRAGTKYGFVRNISDPVINGDLSRNLQVAWAVLTYQLKGLYTSYNGALATWAMVA